MFVLDTKALRIAQNKLLRDFNKPLELLEKLGLPKEELAKLQDVLKTNMNKKMSELVDKASKEVSAVEPAIADVADSVLSAVQPEGEIPLEEKAPVVDPAPDPIVEADSF